VYFYTLGSVVFGYVLLLYLLKTYWFFKRLSNFLALYKIVKIPFFFYFIINIKGLLSLAQMLREKRALYTGPRPLTTLGTRPYNFNEFFSGYLKPTILGS